MQIISVSNSSEKLMLTMVSRLRRLFRNALRTTKLPSVIIRPKELQPMCRNPSTMFICEAV